MAQTGPPVLNAISVAAFLPSWAEAAFPTFLRFVGCCDGESVAAAQPKRGSCCTGPLVDRLTDMGHSEYGR